MFADLVYIEVLREALIGDAFVSTGMVAIEGDPKVGELVFTDDLRKVFEILEIVWFRGAPVLIVKSRQTSLPGLTELFKKADLL